MAPLRTLFRSTVTLLLLSCEPHVPLAIGPDAEKVDVSTVVGKPASEWKLDTWVNSPPQSVTNLRGKVVLVRWFMSSECPYCSATAPALVDLHDRYNQNGLAVIGMYHHKSDGPLVLDDVRSLVADHYKFQFPVAIDEGWQTLRDWWLDAHPDSWTSVSFLLDRRGVIRHVHLGGAYAKDGDDYQQMRDWIERLLAES